MISAKIIKDSVNLHGNRITTMEIEAHRMIWAEFMTHRAFSRNASSSRAIPVEQVIKRVREEPAMPVFWGKNQSGMQAAIEITGDELEEAQKVWISAAMAAAKYSEDMVRLGIHKQIANRITEPFTFIKAVVTATDWDNFWNLRCHKDAQPEIHALADLMHEAYLESTPHGLSHGEWHLPYIDETDIEMQGYTTEEKIAISVSACAQVSYRKNDLSLEKAIKIFNMLLKAEVPHASPFEHVAMASFGHEYKANFCGWESYRYQLGW